MEKLVIKLTVYRALDTALYDAVVSLPLRQRSAKIRQLCADGLRGQGKITIRAEEDALPTDSASTRREDPLNALKEQLACDALAGLSSFV